MNIKYIRGKEIRLKDIEDALNLDYMSYPDEYHLSLNTCLDYFAKNSDIYFMAYDIDDDKVVGYINFSPVTKGIYSSLYSGRCIDTVITSNDVEVYSPNGKYHGYLSSIVVHPDYRRLGIARNLMHQTEQFISKIYAEDNIVFTTIFADAISDAGFSLLSKMDFKEVNRTEHNTRIMERRWIYV